MRFLYISNRVSDQGSRDYGLVPPLLMTMTRQVPISAPAPTRFQTAKRGNEKRPLDGAVERERACLRVRRFFPNHDSHQFSGKTLSVGSQNGERDSKSFLERKRMHLALAVQSAATSCSGRSDLLRPTETASAIQKFKVKASKLRRSGAERRRGEKREAEFMNRCMDQRRRTKTATTTQKAQERSYQSVRLSPSVCRFPTELMRRDNVRRFGAVDFALSPFMGNGRMRGIPKKSSDSRIVLRSHSLTHSVSRININIPASCCRGSFYSTRGPLKICIPPSPYLPNHSALSLSASSSLLMMMKPSLFSPPFAFVFCRRAAALIKIILV